VSARILVAVRVAPRAREDRVAGERAGRLLVRVSAPPEAGAANRAVTLLLAKRLGLRQADVRIERGESDRDKTVSVPASAAAALAGLMK
jgi:uncharacterized protein (TIGR00251 family)